MGRCEDIHRNGKSEQRSWVSHVPACQKLEILLNLKKLTRRSAHDTHTTLAVSILVSIQPAYNSVSAPRISAYYQSRGVEHSAYVGLVSWGIFNFFWWLQWVFSSPFPLTLGNTAQTKLLKETKAWKVTPQNSTPTQLWQNKPQSWQGPVPLRTSTSEEPRGHLAS